MRQTLEEGIKLGQWRKISQADGPSNYVSKMFLVLKDKPDGTTKVRACTTGLSTNTWTSSTSSSSTSTPSRIGETS